MLILTIKFKQTHPIYDVKTSGQSGSVPSISGLDRVRLGFKILAWSKFWARLRQR